MTRHFKTDLKSFLLVVLAAMAVLVLAAYADQAEEESASAPRATEEELEEFVPSERVAADRGVSFPVDI
jgi:hypothetical protein